MHALELHALELHALESVIRIAPAVLANVVHEAPLTARHRRRSCVHGKLAAILRQRRPIAHARRLKPTSAPRAAASGQR